MTIRETRQDLRTGNGRAGPTWKWIAGVLLAILGGVVASVAWRLFYLREDGVKLEQVVSEHVKSADWRNTLQDEQIHRASEQIKEMRAEQRRIDHNVIRIGERLRVRDLDVGDDTQ